MPRYRVWIKRKIERAYDIEADDSEQAVRAADDEDSEVSFDEYNDTDKDYDIEPLNEED